MLDFSEEHKLAAQLVRTWCTTRLGPATVDLEKSKTRPYALMRELCATIGIADTVREALRRGRPDAGGPAEAAGTRGEAGEARGNAGGGRGTRPRRRSNEAPRRATSSWGAKTRTTSRRRPGCP